MTLLVTVDDMHMGYDGTMSRKLHFVTLQGDTWAREENRGLSLTAWVTQQITISLIQHILAVTVGYH